MDSGTTISFGCRAFEVSSPTSPGVLIARAQAGQNAPARVDAAPPHTPPGLGRVRCSWSRSPPRRRNSTAIAFLMRLGRRSAFRILRMASSGTRDRSSASRRIAPTSVSSSAQPVSGGRGHDVPPSSRSAGRRFLDQLEQREQVLQVQLVAEPGDAGAPGRSSGLSRSPSRLRASATRAL
jgi:hypothetical protein